MQKPNESPRMRVLIRVAVTCALVGLACVLLFLWSGFTPLSMGVGIMLGCPLLLVAILLYVIVVARDLRKHGLF
jgi:uncharacterized membrane protein YgaE (UPF0421/DUF939 family)